MRKTGYGLVAFFLVPAALAGNRWHTLLPGGEMRFQGVLIANACTVEAGDRNQYVTMGTVSSNRFRQAGDDADPVPFDIHLTNCSTNVSHHVGIQFRGVADSVNPDILAVAGGPDAATGVGVALFNERDELLPVNQAPSSWTRLYTGPVTLHFVAKYRATRSEVTGGTADTQAWFDLTYD